MTSNDAVKTIRARTRDVPTAPSHVDWDAVATVAMLIGANLAFSGVLQLVPTLNAMAAILPAEPILTGKQTLAAGLGLLGAGGLFFARGRKRFPKARGEHTVSSSRKMAH